VWLLGVMSVAVVLASALGLFWRIDMALYDVNLPTKPPPRDIVVVAIDDASIAQIGRWPWRRAVHAALLDRLRMLGARAVAFDVLMTEPDSSASVEDDALAAAMSHGLPTVLPLMVRFPRGKGPIREELPIPALAHAAAAIGHVNVETDPDGMVRRVFLHEGLGKPDRSYLAVALLESADGAAGTRLCGATHPDLEHADANAWVRDCQILIPYLGPPGHFAQVSYVDVLSGVAGEAALRGKLVLVGATAQGVADAWSTPRSGEAQAMPGVEVMANVLQAQRSGTLIREVPLVESILLSLVPIYVLALGLRRLTPRWSMIFGAGTWLATLGASIAALRVLYWWWPPSTALFALLAIYPLWSWRRLVAAQSFLDEEFVRLAGEQLRWPGSLPQPSPAVRALDPVDRRIELLRRAITGMRKAQRERDDVIRFLSHDMKSPASSLLGLAQLQRDPQRALPPLELSRRLDLLAQRTLTLLDGFVALARAESIDPSAFEEFDIRDALQDAYDEVWAAARAREISILYNPQPELVLLNGDRQLLARAIVNLLGNSIKFSADRSNISLECLQDRGEVIIRVADEGPGIAPEQQAQLFQRFSRGVHRGESDPGGAGLGLAFVRVVAEKHGGRVWFESEDSRGAAFCLSIPPSFEVRHA
jgi:CHASE2 domain-containing sensor protein